MSNWHPISQRPDRLVTAMIRQTGAEGSHLLPGPVAWCIRKDCWVNEATDMPIQFSADATYHWCDEEVIVK